MRKECMKEAYGLLYEVENALRYIIDQTMTSEYGLDWLIQAPLAMNYQSYKKHFSSFYYHELISLLNGYPCIKQLFPPSAIVQLQNTIPIRNKIAHCNLITSEEFGKLSEAYRMVEGLGMEYLF